MFLELIKINDNYKIDKNYHSIMLWDDLNYKKAFMEQLFKNSDSKLKMPIYHTRDTNTFTIDGDYRNYNYCRMRIKENDNWKYYFVINNDLRYEGSVIKTDLTVRYDLIINSDLVLGDINDNCRNDNMLIYRTTDNKFKTIDWCTPNNMMLCSDVCKDIYNEDYFKVKENIYSLPNFFGNLDGKLTNNILLIYVRFSRQTTTATDKNEFSFYKFIMGMTKDFTLNDASKTALDDFKAFTLSYINYELTDYVCVGVPLADNGVACLSFQKLFYNLGKIEKPEEWIEDLKFDIIDIDALGKFGNNITILSAKGKDVPNDAPIVYIFNGNIIKPNAGANKKISAVPFFPIFKTIKNNYEYSHLVYSHLIPYYFSQRWNVKKIINPLWKEYDLIYILGIDNSFPVLFGKNENVKEPFNQESINNALSVGVNVSPFLSEKAKTDNSIINNGLGSVANLIQTGITALGGIIGGVASAGAGTGIGLALGGALGSAVGGLFRGKSGYALTNKNLIKGGISTYANEKKYINNITEWPSSVPRYNIDLIENVLTDRQTKIIKSDREKYGNYINTWVDSISTDSKIDYYEAKFNNFQLNNSDNKLSDLIINIFDRGVFVNKNFIAKTETIELEDASDITVIIDNLRSKFVKNPKVLVGIYATANNDNVKVSAKYDDTFLIDRIDILGVKLGESIVTVGAQNAKNTVTFKVTVVKE